MVNYVNSSAFIIGDTILSNREIVKFENIESLYKTLVKSKELSPIQFWKRFNLPTKSYVLSSLYAIKNTNLSVTERSKESFAVVGSSKFAATNDNIAYYKDYLENNKESSRGNLFVYTLPTVPLGELSIIFKFTGPTLFFGFNENMLKSAIYHCAVMLETYNIKGVLLLIEDETGVASLVMSKSKNLSLEGKNFSIVSLIEPQQRISTVQELSRFLLPNVVNFRDSQGS